MSFLMALALVLGGICLFGAGWMIGHDHGIADAVRIWKARERIDAAKKQRSEKIQL